MRGVSCRGSGRYHSDVMMCQWYIIVYGRRRGIIMSGGIGGRCSIGRRRWVGCVCCCLWGRCVMSGWTLACGCSRVCCVWWGGDGSCRGGAISSVRSNECSVAGMEACGCVRERIVVG